MPNDMSPSRIAVIGAGLAGATCAASLQRDGHAVTLFDKSRGVGGRMATRRAAWAVADGSPRSAEFDHGAQHFTATQPRFRAAMLRAQAAGCVQRWAPCVSASWPMGGEQPGFVAAPTMPALARHTAAGVAQRLAAAVRSLLRLDSGWHLQFDDGETVGPFEQVMLALPPAQAAALLAGHHDLWARELAAVAMRPCWTLMAVTADVDWPWDAAVPERGPLARVMRNDRVPGRGAPDGCATWVAHATPAWSQAHLETDAATVGRVLLAALARVLPGGRLPALQHSAVHRWRYAEPAAAAPDRRECWWDSGRGLGVCGDFLAGGGVEAAWHSGDELACTVAASLEEIGAIAEAA
jgi:renalase